MNNNGAREFSYYFVIGGIATLMDWGTFAFVYRLLALHYLTALTISMGTAGIFHYIANKKLTFQCRTRQIGTQLPVYVGVSFAGLGMSMVVMSLLVKGIGVSGVSARVLTTLLMLLPNYLMHKYLTFSRRLFVQPE